MACTSEMPASIMVESWRVKRTRSVSLTVQVFLRERLRCGFFLERKNHEPAAHETGYGVIFIESVLDAGNDLSGGVACLVGEGNHSYGNYTFDIAL